VCRRGGKKVLVNIKKRKERAKRKKANGRDDEEEVSLMVSLPFTH
jgi:hypothetical protein